ncbi:winged helix-turn-helix domain-containing protein [Micromonospora sp. RTP1Z1]|uniref:winged helix-turn-helix domain-containing protein n=1 Tax=Micromonospora sp. RTP1Z1 TaxID=2994043 RepID=UPI0029C7F25E|nr:winged helix-turn-helix domain-containing protein [Micromonospora sp. RTP1Z1]
MIFPGQGPVGYLELAEILRAQITSGDLGPGARLPSEATLSQTYGVAPKTARAALMQLRNEGLATAVRGYGVVVREPVEPELVRAEPGDQVSARNPTPGERETYEVPEGVPLIVVIHADGLMDLYPADRYRVEMSPA